MRAVRISLFGKAEIRQHDDISIVLPGKVQELLFYLLLHRAQPHNREGLACELWPETSANQAKKYLRQCIWQLQQVFDRLDGWHRPLLYCEQQWVGLDPDDDLSIDVHQFDEVCLLVRDIAGEAFSEQQMRMAQAAHRLYRGDLLSGWYQDWCLIERERFQSMYFALLDKLSDFCIAQSRWDQGIAYSMRILGLEYTREVTHQRLMRLYALSGNRSAALRQFDLCTAAIRKEFGVEPSKQTVSLYQQIRDDQFPENPSARGMVSTLAFDPELLVTMGRELVQLSSTLAVVQNELEQIKQLLFQLT